MGNRTSSWSGCEALRPLQATGRRPIRRFAFLALLLQGCGDVPSAPIEGPPGPQPPEDDAAPTLTIYWDTLMVAADTARVRVTARDSGLVHAVGYSYRGLPVEMVEVTPAVSVTVDLTVPVDEGFHPIRIVALDTTGNQGFADRVVGATRARLNLFAADSVELDELSHTLFSRRRVWGTAPGMVKLEYWGSAHGESGVIRYLGGEIELGSDSARTFSTDLVPPGGTHVEFRATDAHGVRVGTGMYARPYTAQVIFPSPIDHFVPESETTVELRLTARTYFPLLGPEIQRLDLIHPDGDTTAVQITPANEVVFDWWPRLTDDITRLKVRAEMEGGHVTITSFPAVRVAPPQQEGQFSRVDAMWQHSCAVATDGEVHCWGDGAGFWGRLFEQRFVPAPVPVLSDLGLVRFSGAPTHSCGIDGTGIAHCWGHNGSGALGDGTRESRAGPVRVAGDLRFLLLATAWDQTCAVADDRRAYCWGSTANPFARQHNLVPVEVPGGISFSSIVVEGQFCGVSTEGQMYCWTQWTDPAPRLIPAPVQLVQLTKSSDGVCALDAAGDVWCLQGGTLSLRTSGFGFASISRHCGLTTDSRAFCWGYGWLGSGEGLMGSTTPVEVAGGLRFRELAVYPGGHHACGVTLENAVYCWGDGASGQLGNGTRFNLSVPVRARDPVP